MVNGVLIGTGNGVKAPVIFFGLSVAVPNGIKFCPFLLLPESPDERGVSVSELVPELAYRLLINVSDELQPPRVKSGTCRESVVDSPISDPMVMLVGVVGMVPATSDNVSHDAIGANFRFGGISRQGVVLSGLVGELPLSLSVDVSSGKKNIVKIFYQ